MRRGRPIEPLSLTAAERESLERWARRPESVQALTHARAWCVGVRQRQVQHA